MNGDTLRNSSPEMMKSILSLAAAYFMLLTARTAATNDISSSDASEALGQLSWNVKDHFEIMRNVIGNVTGIYQTLQEFVPHLDELKQQFDGNRIEPQFAETVAKELDFNIEYGTNVYNLVSAMLKKCILLIKMAKETQPIVENLAKQS